MLEGLWVGEFKDQRYSTHVATSGASLCIEMSYSTSWSRKMPRASGEVEAMYFGDFFLILFRFEERQSVSRHYKGVAKDLKPPPFS